MSEAKKSQIILATSTNLNNNQSICILLVRLFLTRNKADNLYFTLTLNILSRLPMCFLSVCRCTATCIVSSASIAGTHGVNVFALINNSVTDQTLPRVDRMLQTINKFNDTIKSNYIKSNQKKPYTKAKPLCSFAEVKSLCRRSSALVIHF